MLSRNSRTPRWRGKRGQRGRPDGADDATGDLRANCERKGTGNGNAEHRGRGLEQSTKESHGSAVKNHSRSSRKECRLMQSRELQILR